MPDVNSIDWARLRCAYGSADVCPIFCGGLTKLVLTVTHAPCLAPESHNGNLFGWPALRRPAAWR